MVWGSGGEPMGDAKEIVKGDAQGRKLTGGGVRLPVLVSGHPQHGPRLKVEFITFPSPYAVGIHV